VDRREHEGDGMADGTLADLTAQLVRHERELARLRRHLTSAEGPHWRGDPSRRAVVGAILAALLLALVPVSLLAGSSQPFADVDPASIHAPNIAAIRQAGITTGCVPEQNLYCPSTSVRRDELASFLARTAGLGDNPPVANARTAISAQTATQAASADVATTALTLQGWAANALVRTGAGENGNVTTLSGTPLPVVSMVLMVPAPGFVWVTGTAVLNVGPSGATSLVGVAVADPATGATALPVYQHLGWGVGTVDTSAVASTAVFPVQDPGAHTFLLEAHVVTGSGNPVAYNATLTALYVPFGPDGGQAAGSAQPPARP
jgi:hypothetical protein